MSYDPVTRTRSCDVCGSSSEWRMYYPCPGVYYQRTMHICTVCVDGGAYWCWACKKIHATGKDCLQLPLPLFV